MYSKQQSAWAPLLSAESTFVSNKTSASAGVSFGRTGSSKTSKFTLNSTFVSSSFIRGSVSGENVEHNIKVVLAVTAAKK